MKTLQKLIGEKAADHLLYLRDTVQVYSEIEIIGEKVVMSERGGIGKMYIEPQQKRLIYRPTPGAEHNTRKYVFTNEPELIFAIRNCGNAPHWPWYWKEYDRLKAIRENANKTIKRIRISRMLAAMCLFLFCFGAAAQTPEGKVKVLDFISKTKQSGLCVIEAKQKEGKVVILAINTGVSRIDTLLAFWSNGEDTYTMTIQTPTAAGNPISASRPVNEAGYKLVSIVAYRRLYTDKFRGKDLEAITMPEDMKKGAGL